MPELTPCRLTVLVPFYNEHESLGELYTRIIAAAEPLGVNFEMVFVDDGSTDGSWDIISQLATSDQRIKAVRFNRNYGKSAALNTGFRECNGEVVITMDADLQDSPEEIPALYQMISEEGFDIVSGWKKKRYDPFIKRSTSKLFNFVTKKITGIKLHDFNCGLKAYKRDVVKNIDIYGEMHRYIPVIAHRKGFTGIGEKEVKHDKRKYGTTKFGGSRFIYGFLDLISVLFVSTFRKRPMHFFGLWGVLSFFIGFIITGWLIGKKLYNVSFGYPVRDVTEQPLFYLALVALIIGVQLFLTGFLGEMMVGLRSKEKNEYIIRDTVGF